VFSFPTSFFLSTTKILGEFLKFSLISSLNLTNFSSLWGGGAQGGEKFAKPLSQKIGKEKLKLQIVILQKDNLAKFWL